MGNNWFNPFIFAICIFIYGCNEPIINVSQNNLSESTNNPISPTSTECTDGTDNDSDGLIDANDLGCTSLIDNSEGGLSTGSIENTWTVIEPTPNTQVIYVSSSLGSDTYNGLHPYPIGANQGPKQTIAAATSNLGSGGWLLLKRGDIFPNIIGIVSGPSLNEPSVVAPYGPLLDQAPRINSGFDLAGRSNLYILGLDFSSHSINSTSGGQNILIEGNKFKDPQYSAIDIAGSIATTSKIKIRNNLIDGSGSNGLYTRNVQDLLIEGNILYRTAHTNSGNHAMYIAREGNTSVKIIKNLVWMGKKFGNGIMQRPGGIAFRNLVSGHGYTGITAGACNDSGAPPSGPNCFSGMPQFSANQNMIMAPYMPDPNIGCGIGVSTLNLSGALITENIAAAYAQPSNCFSDPFGWSSSIGAQFQFANNRVIPLSNPLASYQQYIGMQATESSFWLNAVSLFQFRNLDPRYTADSIYAWMSGQ